MSDDEDSLSLAGIDSAQQSTYIWRTADNPTATFNPFTASAFPSDVSTFWIPVDLGSTTSWEAAVPSLLPGGYTDIVPASLPASSDLPASTTSSSMSRLWVKTIPTFTRVANDAMVRAGVAGQSTFGSASRSALASTEVSTGAGAGAAAAGAAAAGKVGCGIGGVVVAAVGALVVM